MTELFGLVGLSCLLSLCLIGEPPVGFVECERIAVTGHDHVVVIIDDYHATVVVDGMIMPSRFAESIATTIRFLAKITEPVPVCYDDFFHSVSPRLLMKESPLSGDESTCGLLKLTKHNSSKTQTHQGFELRKQNFPQPDEFLTCPTLSVGNPTNKVRPDSTGCRLIHLPA
jgi:hypothetical protein